MLGLGKLKVESICGGLGVFDATSNAFKCHPQESRPELQWEVTPNVSTVFEVRGRRRDRGQGPGRLNGGVRAEALGSKRSQTRSGAEGGGREAWRPW